ncbi:hypothetical protein [Fodinicurvata sediminis]|nr:hypothetical protein [Fodinicurvata sediminis]
MAQARVYIFADDAYDRSRLPGEAFFHSFVIERSFGWRPWKDQP